MIFRQGDVLIRKIDSLPKVKLSEVINGVLVYGEVTGHAHRIRGGKVYKHKDNMYLNVGKTATIVHEEHKPIQLDRGYYSVIRQREYVSADMIKVVTD